MPDEKKATPTAAHETQHHHNNLDKPYKPKSQRERRVLAALVNGSVIRHDLDTIVGTDNAPEYVSQARAMNWHIKTERVPMIDRDGKKISVGRYSLSPEHQALAAKLLNDGG